MITLRKSRFWWGEKKDGMEAPEGFVLESSPNEFLICKRLSDGKRFYADVRDERVIGIQFEVCG